MTDALLRRRTKHAVFAASVGHDLRLRVGAQGVDTGAGGPIGWEVLERVLIASGGLGPTAPEHLASWLRLRHRLAELPSMLLPSAVRVVGMPVDHPLHPGLDWVVERVHGDALDLGLGVRGLDRANPSRVVAVPVDVWRSLDLDHLAWWHEARAALERAGAVAAAWLVRQRDGVLRQQGDADAVTLLGSATLRAALAADHHGLATLALPARGQGWTRLSAVDPAFVPPAAMATSVAERGFTRPVLVTREEVVLAAAGTWLLEAISDGRVPTPDLALRSA